MYQYMMMTMDQMFIHLAITTMMASYFDGTVTLQSPQSSVSPWIASKANQHSAER
jgi:hypothetical protein